MYHHHHGKRALIAVVMALLLAPVLSHAQEKVSVESMLEGLLTLTRAKCPDVERQIGLAQQKNDKTVIEALESVHATLCECVPGKIHRVLSGLSDNARQEALSQEQFLQRFGPQIIGRCGAEQLRSQFVAPSCPAKASSIARDGQKYCECMSARVAALSDADAVKVGTQNSDYTPLAAQAAKEGRPPPEPPQPLKQFLEAETNCRKLH